MNHDDDEGRSKRWPTALGVATLTHMVAITINVPAENIEKMKELAERTGRSLDEVIGAIANDAIEYELGGDDADPAWDAELLRRIESVRNGTAKTVPAEEVFAEIRARFAR